MQSSVTEQESAILQRFLQHVSPAYDANYEISMINRNGDGGFINDTLHRKQHVMYLKMV